MARPDHSLTGSPTALPQHPGRPSVGRRYRLIICVALYGGALGAAALLVALVARAKLRPPLYEPEHMAFLPSVFLSGAGVIAGALVAALLTYWVVKRADNAQHPLIWVALGVGFALIVPFATGALAPVSIVFLNLNLGVIAPDEIFSGLIDSAFRAPSSAFAYGAMSLAPTAVAALLFAAGAWLIDAANASDNVKVSRYGTCAITLALSFGFVAFAALGPPSTVATLG